MSKIDEILKKTSLNASEPPSLQSWRLFLNEINLTLEVEQRKQREIEQEHLETLSKIQNHIVATAKLSTLSGMLGGFAHEINNPLAVIQMRTDQLLDATQAGEFDQEMFQKSLISMDVTCKRINSIVARLRTYAKSEGKEALVTTSCKKLIEETLTLCHDKFTSHGIKLEFISTEDSDVKVRPSEISQALIQILNNSYDAAFNSDQRWVCIELKKTGQQAVIEVSDSGQFQDVLTIQKSFNPFFTTKDPDKHAGLGLTIAQGTFKEHGGDIKIEGTEKTKFVINLPIYDSLKNVPYL